MFNNQFMNQALDQAKLALRMGEVPIGAILVNNQTNEVIAADHNRVETKKCAALHAEMNVINSACQLAEQKYLTGHDLYVTLEPCAMCAAAIAHCKIDRIFYGASDPKGGAIEYGARIFTLGTTHHRPEIIPGILEEECSKILKEFFKQIRK